MTTGKRLESMNVISVTVILCCKNVIYFLREVSSNLPAETASGWVGGGSKVTRRRFQGAASSPLLMPGVTIDIRKDEGDD